MGSGLFRSYFLNKKEGEEAEDSPDKKGQFPGKHPQEASQEGEKNRRYMINGKADRHGGSNIFDISRFLKIGFDSHRKIKE